MQTRTMKVSGKTIPVNIVFEKRVNCRVSIGKKGINLRITTLMRPDEQEAQIEKMMDWARKKIGEKPALLAPKTYRDYEKESYLKVGRYRFKIVIERKWGNSSSAHLSGTTIKLKISRKLDGEDYRESVSTLISRCVGRFYLDDIKTRLTKLNQIHFKKALNNVRLKHNKSNWGSCSGKGNINISTRVLFAPPDVIDYVLIHELAHLVEQNHSENFWNLVEKVMPDYKEKERWLKENSQHCYF